MFKTKILFISILILTIFLRFYDLGSNPPSLDWDEASLGYNAYSLLETGKDEYGISWPINLKSFGDYKPAAYVYLTLPSIALLGLNELSVRLPSALFGVLTVISFYGITSALFKNKKNKTRIALTATVLLALSPWHIQFSRIAFEANIGLSFFVAGLCMLLYSKKTPITIPVGFLFWVLSLYSYHSMRLFVPLFFIGTFWYFKSVFFLYRRWFAVGIVLGCIALVPLLQSYVDPETRARFQAVNIFSNLNIEEAEKKQIDTLNHDVVGRVVHTQKFNQVRTIAKNYLDHFDLNFLFLKGDEYGRHGAVDMGLLYLVELPFLLLGIVYLYKRHRRTAYLCLAWMILAPIPSAITEGTPHAVRFLTILPLPYVVIAVGIVEFLHTRIPFKKVGASLFVCIFSINIAYYLSLYFIHTPVEASQDWQYGYKQVIDYLRKHERNYSKIVITNAYDQPYVYLLFYTPVDPRAYQRQTTNPSQAFRSFEKYEFRKIDWNSDQQLSDTLLVVAPDELPSGKEDAVNYLEEIKFLDGTTAFYIIGK